MRKLAAALTAAASVSTVPAMANQCPQTLALLDGMIQSHASMLSPEQLAKARELRAQAEADHKAGRHEQSLQDITEAERAMGM